MTWFIFNWGCNSGKIEWCLIVCGPDVVDMIEETFCNSNVLCKQIMLHYLAKLKISEGDMGQGFQE